MKKRRTKRRMRKKKQLTNKDYENILRKYESAPGTSARNSKKRALTVLAGKFCRCIKKVKEKKNTESKAIGICTNSVIKLKGFKRGKFNCKKNKEKVEIYKGGKKTKRRRRRRGGDNEDVIEQKCLAAAKECIKDINNKEICDKEYKKCVNTAPRDEQRHLLGGRKKKRKTRRKKRRRKRRRRTRRK